MESNELLTPKEAAALLKVPVGTLANWRVYDRGWLPFVKLGRLVRYRRADIESFVSALGRSPNQKPSAWQPPDGTIPGPTGKKGEIA